jgi:hypothetical protein
MTYCAFPKKILRKVHQAYCSIFQEQPFPFFQIYLATLAFENYFYYSFKNKHYVFEIKKAVQSQYIRKVICENEGLGNVWNWASYPFRDKITAMIEKYRDQRNTIKMHMCETSLMYYR